MAVLFAASEVEAFRRVYGVTGVRNRSTAGSFNSTFARGSLGVSQNSLVAAEFTPSTEIWVHMEVYFGTMGAGSTTPTIYFVDNVAGQVVAQFDGDGTTATNNLEYWNGAAFTEITPDDTLAVNTKYLFDFHLKIDNVNGRFAYYRDGTLKQEFLGDTLNSPYTAIDGLVLAGFGAGASTDSGFSQVIVATQSTIGMRLMTLAPTGNGTNTAWTGTFSDISSTVIETGSGGLANTYIYSGASGDKETYACTDMPAASKSGFEPIAVVVAARGRTHGTGPTALHLGVRTNSTDDFASALALSAELQGAYRVLELNPVTGRQWTYTELDALEIGVKGV